MSSQVPLFVRRLTATARIPFYASSGAACFDLRADRIVSRHSTSVIVATGLAFGIPDGYVMKVHSRSGQGFNHDVRLSNCTGVIDSDYVGEVMVKLVADSIEGIAYLESLAVGDRIAQAEITLKWKANFIEVAGLNETERGSNGFGSTGNK
ncbi:deoxyuridine 5'-triphosphate nucleotidohydrolase [Yersinia phage vB_YenS_P400]|nr:deoxyuridine 5'-triphosphate nucleotidohydrolase [Yersinia phage vB_YenS_P400]